MGFGAGLFLYLHYPVLNAWPIIVSVQLGALLGFTIGVVASKSVSYETSADLGWTITAVLLTMSGLILFLRGIGQRDVSNALYGAIIMITPLGYGASKDEKKGILTSLTSLALAVLFVALSIINHNSLWLILGVLGMVAAAGYYIRSGKSLW